LTIISKPNHKQNLSSGIQRERREATCLTIAVLRTATIRDHFTPFKPEWCAVCPEFALRFSDRRTGTVFYHLRAKMKDSSKNLCGRRKKRYCTLETTWDAGAGVWIATSYDVLGLAHENKSCDASIE